MRVDKRIRYPGVGSGNGGERYEFRQCVLSKIGRLTPRWTPEIRQLVSDDWGEVGLRKVQRAVRWLRINQLVRRTDSGYLVASMQRRPVTGLLP
ncbi:MAG TPA: hypothetical protein VFT22_07190 [Kofleriaceae bacterium]|nr:hypothetical protein [Kofleriaceae bacterium]